MKILFNTLLSLFLCTTLNAQRVSIIADSNNLFAFKLYNEVNKGTRENLFFSPFSISTALAMTYAGARNETEKQMSRTLHFSLEQNTFHHIYKNYLETIGSDTGKDLVIGISNSLWIANSLKLSEPFSETVTTDYNSEAKNVDFSKTEQVRNEINSWVEQKTKDKIKDLILPGMLDKTARLVLVNAIYFKGKWNNPFSKDSTKNGVFHENSEKDVKTDFMHNTGRYRYYEDSLLQAVEIPYSGVKTSMIIFLPNQASGINNMEHQLNYSYYSKIVAMLDSRRVMLSVPKFITTEGFELSKALSDMGMRIAFSGKADFSGISTEGLHISYVIHKAFIEVNEEGTEAAAATAVVMGKMIATRPKPIAVFKANHPFIFIIRDNATGSILFMGKISNPVTN